MPYSFPASRRGVALLLAVMPSVTGLSACGGTADSAPRRVVIPAGSSFRAATDSLVSARIISSPHLFRIYSTVRRLD